MAASNTPTTSACAIRVLFGSHLGSSKRSYADRLEDGADLVEGKAVRKSPTVKQAAADVNVDPTALGYVLRRRGWRGWNRRAHHPAKRRASDSWQSELQRLALVHGTDALVNELAAMEAPAGAALNGAAVTSTNGTRQHVRT
jgi:hypothetical protein